MDCLRHQLFACSCLPVNEYAGLCDGDTFYPLFYILDRTVLSNYILQHVLGIIFPVYRKLGMAFDFSDVIPVVMQVRKFYGCHRCIFVEYGIHTTCLRQHTA